MNRRIALPWYNPDSYAQLRDLITDRHALVADYNTWRISAEQNEATALSLGLEVVRVLIEPDTFVSWCAERRLEPNGKARTQFAEAVARAAEAK